MKLLKTNVTNKTNVLYERQFGKLAIKQVCDSGKYPCGVFLDLQKTLDTVNYDILLKKLNHYGIRGIANNWFYSFLSDRMQYTSINKSESGKRLWFWEICLRGIPWFTKGTWYCESWILNSAQCITLQKTLMLLAEKSLKMLNNHMNRDLKLVVEWIRTNKLSLNTSKTELVVFKSRNKKITKNLNFRISGQKIQPTSQVRYLGVTLQHDLHWATHLGSLRKKLSHSTGLLRHYVPKHLLRTLTIYIIHYLTLI